MSAPNALPDGTSYPDPHCIKPQVNMVKPTTVVDNSEAVYTYVGNDPTDKTDPSGECPSCIGFVVSAGLDYALQVTDNLAHGQNLHDAATNVNVGSILVSGLAGAAGVGIATKINKLAKVGEAAKFALAV